MAAIAKDMIGRRSELLATVVLTRRLNVDVHSFGDKSDDGIDLIGTIRPDSGDKVQGFLPFGIYVWGTARELQTEAEATKFARLYKKKIPKEKFVLPVIVLLFSMQKDEAFFSWLVKPGSKSNKLYECQELNFTQFDMTQLDKMILRIKSWYHRLQTSMLLVAGETDSSHSHDDGD